MYILYIHACTFPWKSAVLIKILRQSDKSNKSTWVNKNLGCSFMQHNLTKGFHPHTYRPFAVQGYTGHAANEWRSVSGGRSPQQQREKVLRSNAKRISLMFSCMFVWVVVHVNCVSFVFGSIFFLYYPPAFSALWLPMGHVEKIIGLPASQYTDICFPFVLSVLNYESHYLTLTYSTHVML